MMGAVSWVTIRLAADGEDATRFELEHTSRTADIPAEMWETFGPGATGVGWDGGLLGLGSPPRCHRGLPRSLGG